MKLDEKIVHLSETGQATQHNRRLVGIEKECLRVGDNAVLALTPHPPAFGAALTNPCITMDFSEALLELITPPMNSNDDAIEFMSDVHTWVCERLGDELLWPGSMPCVTKGETTIPLAHFGSSNAGKMKTIYRRGLGHRYGRTIQTIAGIHYNYSFGENLWPSLADLEGVSTPLAAARSDFYLGLTRNVLRWGWVVPFLFGSSPAICKTFAGGNTQLEHFDDTTLYLPYATSLRMGGIGYQNNQENEQGINVSYNSMDEHLASLKHAIRTPCESYRAFGVKVDGRYEQLNNHILQIENEHYASVRPKCTVLNKDEIPLLALARRGVEYLELRSLDLLAFSPIGIDTRQTDFLEAWLCFCLLEESPPLSSADLAEINHNEITTAHTGRKPNLSLMFDGKEIPLRDKGLDLCSRMEGVCAWLDLMQGSERYISALTTHRAMFMDADQTPSARMLNEMREKHASYIEWAEHKALEFRDYHLSRKLSDERTQLFNQLAEDSLKQQAELEGSDKLTLDEYIDNYFERLEEI